MTKKILLITGGTGGHVIPAQNLANFLINKKINCSLMIDKRGSKYINSFKGKINIVNSSNLNGNLLNKILGTIHLFLGFIKSFLIIILLKPDIVISFGSYASFFPMLSCVLLKPFYNIAIFIHEQNSILGRTNKFFIHFTNKIFLNFDILTKINKKFQNKTYVVGSPENNLKYSNSIKNKFIDKNFTIFIFGGSQGSEYVSNFSLNLIKIIDKESRINTKFIMQCPKNMIDKIKQNTKNIKSQIIIKDFFHNIDEILSNSSIVISRAGAGSITDLINHEIPSILIPLPTSKDNHQFYNATIMAKYELAIIIDQKKNETNKAKNYIYEIYNNATNVKIYENFNKIKIKNTNALIYKLISNEK